MWSSRFESFGSAELFQFFSFIAHAEKEVSQKKTEDSLMKNFIVSKEISIIKKFSNDLKTVYHKFFGQSIFARCSLSDVNLSK